MKPDRFNPDVDHVHDRGNHQPQVDSVVDALRQRLQLRRARVGSHKQLGGIDQEIEDDQTERAHDQPRHASTLDPLRPYQHGGRERYIHQHHHHKQGIDGLPHRAKPEEGNARAQDEVLIVQSDQPPDAEYGLQQELRDQLESRLARTVLYQRRQLARVPGVLQPKPGAKELQGGENQSDPGEGHQRDAGIAEQHSQALHESLAGGAVAILATTSTRNARPSEAFNTFQ